jgi:hypothetical protein
MFPVNVSPDMAMYNLLKNQGYETSYALAEFIDNAIHAWQQEKHKGADQLQVTVKYYPQDYKVLAKRNSIEVTDNGPGIARNQIANAFKPAKLPAAKGLSEFGIGMKTAAVWFADEWTLITRPANDKNEYCFQFNLDELLKSGSDMVNVEEKIKKGNESGTTIFLHNLRKPISSDKFKEICQDIRELYQFFTSGNNKVLTLSAEYDDTPVDLNYLPPNRSVLNAPIHKNIKGSLYAIGPDRKWLEKISFKFKGCHIHGYIQLLETGSYTSNPGLVLFRHNRVIMGINRVPYIPEKLFGTANKYGKQRIYGELHLDGLPVSYTKDKFEFDEDEFISLIKGNTAVVELLRQSGDYRANGTPIIIAFEDDLKGGNSKTGKAGTGQGKEKNSAGGSASNEKNKNGQSENAGDTDTGKNAGGVNGFVTVLKSLHTTSLGLQDIITEAIEQYETDHPISTALCYRIVLEVGVLSKIERDKKSEHAKVASMGIKKILNHMNNNLGTFFDKSEQNISKCVESLAKGTQLDIILINNVAHGHYHPSIDEINKLMSNSQPLLEWAYS